MGAKRAASRSTVASDTAMGLRLGEVDHLRFGAQLGVEPERPRALGEPGHLAAGVGKIAEDDGPGGAGLGASRDVVAGGELAALPARAVARLLEPVVAERALLDDALGPHRHVGVLARRRLLVAQPVEVLGVVGARGHAEPAADAARVDLGDDALRVAVCGVHRAHPRARRIVALKTWPG